MPQCAVDSCRNSHRRTRGRRIRYHRFPPIPEVRQLWVSACGRTPLPNGDIPFNIQTARICSHHFTNDAYEKDMEHLMMGHPVRSRLRRGAVPTDNVPVKVKPITNLLVEESRRSVLKIAQAKMLAGKKTNGVNGKQQGVNGKQQGVNGKQQKPKPKPKQQMPKMPPPKMPPPKMLPPQVPPPKVKVEPEIVHYKEGMEVLQAVGLKPRLNKMHAMDDSGANGENLEAGEKKEEDDVSRQSPQVPQSQQNGAALPEEAAAATADRLHSSVVKQEPFSEGAPEAGKKSTAVAPLQKQQDEKGSRKRRSTEEVLAANGSKNSKKICIDQRQQLVSSLIIGYENATADELASRSEVLRVELLALDDMARAAEMEWNKVLTMKKLKEEAYFRIERRRQIVNFMEGSDKVTLGERLPLNSECDWDGRRSSSNALKEGISQENSGSCKSEKATKHLQQSVQNPLSRHSVDAKKQAEALIESRQIGEGRQGAILNVQSIIADYRLRHPETVPRSSDHDCRGRRMRNNVNIGLGAGGAIIETGQNADSRPSSTDSCKSNSNVDPNNPMSFKDVLVQFAKLSQQQGEPVKTPQNYPDVTLHPVASAPLMQNSAPQQSGSLLHGILTKAQSPRPTTFSPTLARLLTAPERERSTPVATGPSHPTSATQRMLQAYHEPNPVSISDLLSSSKARTEITITPVVNAPVQSHGNNMMHVDDVEEDSGMMDERDLRISGKGEERDISPRCQGCHDRTAQYVCAGCGNQWYCSPECQAAAWDEHSEVCSG